MSDTQDPVFNMRLHSVLDLTHCWNMSVLRVPGGWIYYNHTTETNCDGIITERILSDGVFVPFVEKDNE